ncbi:MAG: AmmeMemoRadiSam system protein A [Verrucomicrobia bacterium]|nr:AmmeMemoRadiSam system protein A [Verrucomicrobiota bacterium]
MKPRSAFRVAVLVALPLSVALAAGGEDAVKSATVEEVIVKEHRSGEWSPELSDAEMQTLFSIADDTLAWCVGGQAGRFDFSPYRLTEKLKTPMATFVTLKIRGLLRGCIGSLMPVAPLYESVHDNAINAALKDHRFRPVGPAELPRLDVHVSILSPIVPIGGIEAFKLGEHGIILEKGYHRAVYLPEVAPEQGWTVEETLSSLSQKAGMPANGWRSGANFKVFSSVVLAKD